MTTNSSTPTFCDYFCDPYDIRTSFQLSDRLRNGEALNSIDRIRDADAALQKASYRAFLRLIRPVISFLNPGQRGQVISRIIYNDMYLQSFKPVFLALPSSNAEGRFNIGSERSVHRELGINMEAIRKTLACASRDYFHGLYGKDISRTSFSVRPTWLVTENLRL